MSSKLKKELVLISGHSAVVDMVAARENLQIMY
jgi:hypothetical protein